MTALRPGPGRGPVPGAGPDGLDALRRLPLTVEGVRRAGDDLAAYAAGLARREDFRGDLGRFLLEWLSPSPTVLLRTSGSTGEPRDFPAEKVRMAAGARATCDFLRLREGDTALLCMPLRYVAARMVVVRALVAGLDLVPVRPSASPLADVPGRIAFAAMTPMQAWESLKSPETAARLRAVASLLLGGGPVGRELEEALEDFPGEAWSSYGMTETLSHVALRRVNGPDASGLYEPLPGVEVRLSPEGTLAVRAPRVAEGEIVTRDAAEIAADGRFRILGRRDNVVVTGGVKVRLEALEDLLAPALRRPFCATSLPDPSLGERIVLLFEGDMEEAALDALCRGILPRYWVPKLLLRVERVPLTDTGKTARAAARELASRALPSRGADKAKTARSLP